MEFRVRMRKIRLTNVQVLIIAFALLIAVGTIFLSLPIATRDQTATPLVNALFTSTSASCVIGLTVYDTYNYWSVFGQTVILFLMQIGGLGIMTIATLFMLLLKKKIGINQRILIREASNTQHIGGVIRLMKLVLSVTAICEGVGALLLSFRFCPEMGLLAGIYNAIFHAISAFCNCGLDLMGRFASFSSLSHYSNDLYVNLVVIALIIIGGLGSLVWSDIYVHGLKWKKYMLHTKVVLSTSAFLILVPTIMIFFMEHQNAFLDKSVGETLLMSLFHSVSPRTAGFSTVDITTLTVPSILLIVSLMLIGGSPGSTAGGIKTTTFFIIFMSTIATIRNKQHITAFSRRIEDSALKKAGAILFIYFFVSLTAMIIIGYLETFSVREIFFEVFSASGTAGMSIGITPFLSSPSKILLVFLMFFGRLGVMSLAMIFARSSPDIPLQRPVEKIMIG